MLNHRAAYFVGPADTTQPRVQGTVSHQPCLSHIRHVCTTQEDVGCNKDAATWKFVLPPTRQLSQIL